MKRAAAILLAAVMLTACSAVGQVFIEAAKENRRAFNDNKAEVGIQIGICDMTLGAFVRLPDVDKAPISILAMNRCP